MFNKYTKIIIIFSVFFFLLSINIYSAQGAIIGNVENCVCEGKNCSDNQTDECSKYCCGNYGLNDFVQIFVNYYQRIFGLVGSIALLMFIYGGVMFLISGGSSEKVTQAKQIIISAIIGLIIIFASYAIIDLVFTVLEVPNAENRMWAKTGWFK